jgi:hypothetical protein
MIHHCSCINLYADTTYVVKHIADNIKLERMRTFVLVPLWLLNHPNYQNKSKQSQTPKTKQTSVQNVLLLDIYCLFLEYIDPCSPNPCLNGGSCTRDGRHYTCSCQNGYTGLTCNGNVYISMREMCLVFSATIIPSSDGKNSMQMSQI